MELHTTDGARLHVQVDGPCPHEYRARHTLVLTHGFCMSGNSWARVRQSLRRRFPELRVVSYDHRGHGRSTAGSRPPTIAQLAADLDTVLSAATPVGQIMLAGHSLGAMVVLAHLAEHPEVLPRLDGVAVVGSAAGGLAETGMARLIPEGWFAALPALANRSPESFDRLWSAARRAVAPMVGAGGGGGRRPAAQVIAEVAASVRAFDVRDRLDVLAAVPTLLVSGTRDRVTPPVHAEQIVARLPHAELKLLAGGHNLPVECPSGVAAAMSTVIGKAFGRPVSAADIPAL